MELTWCWQVIFSPIYNFVFTIVDWITPKNAEWEWHGNFIDFDQFLHVLLFKAFTLEELKRKKNYARGGNFIFSLFILKCLRLKEGKVFAWNQTEGMLGDAMWNLNPLIQNNCYK